jgi:hypothetical protein
VVWTACEEVAAAVADVAGTVAGEGALLGAVETAACEWAEETVGEAAAVAELVAAVGYGEEVEGISWVTVGSALGVAALVTVVSVLPALLVLLALWVLPALEALPG